MAREFADLLRTVAGNMMAVSESAYPLAIQQAVALILDAFRSDHKLLVFGNGGSSTDAQHFTAEFVGRFAAERRALPAIALTTNQAILTAWSNDYSFDGIFARQIDARRSTTTPSTGSSRGKSTRWACLATWRSGSRPAARRPTS
jgi:D-sedoheptulose 7-phosphate isomerase